MHPMSAKENESHGYGPAPDDPVTIDATEENYGRGRIVLLLGVVMVVAVAGVIYAVYEQGARSRSEPVLITAEKGPMKVAPDEPGGAVIEHQDKYVYDQISGADEPQVEVLLPEAEEPMDLSGLRTVKSSETLPDSASSQETAAATNDAAPEPAPALPQEETQKALQSGDYKVESQSGSYKDNPKSGDYVGALIAETSATPEETAAPSQSAVSGAYVIQVGAYDKSSAAATAWDRLSQKHSGLLANLRPDIQVADLGEKGTWYRLRVGPFADKASANELCSRLKDAGQDCLVRKP